MDPRMTDMLKSTKIDCVSYFLTAFCTSMMFIALQRILFLLFCFFFSKTELIISSCTNWIEFASDRD